MAVVLSFGALDLAGAAQDLLAQNVSKIVVDSRLLPQIVVDDPFGAAPAGAAPSWILGQVRPRITVYTAQGPIVVAPYGDPGETTYWPLVAAGLALGGVLSLYGLVKLLRGGRR